MCFQSQCACPAVWRKIIIKYTYIHASITTQLSLFFLLIYSNNIEENMILSEFWGLHITFHFSIYITCSLVVHVFAYLK